LAFFTGAFLAAFLVAICLFSLSDDLQRSCNTYIPLTCFVGVKGKAERA
jgi:hypothetical protein